MKPIKPLITFLLGIFTLISYSQQTIPIQSKSKIVTALTQFDLRNYSVTKISNDSLLAASSPYSLVTEKAAKQYADSVATTYLNVKKFGAKGNGVTNDAPAIQAAINSLKKTGGTIYFPKGNYRVLSSIVLLKTNDVDYDNIVLIGDGYKTQLSCVANQNDNTLTHILKIASSSAFPIKNVEVKNIYFNGNATAQMGGNHVGDGGMYHGGIFAQNCNGLKIKDCYFEYTGTQAIYVGRWETDNAKGSINCTVSGNRLKKCWADGIYNQVNTSCTITNNQIDSCGTGNGHFALFVEGVYDCVVANNTVLNCYDGIMINNAGTVKRSNTTCSNNTVKYTMNNGIYLAGCYGVTCTSNSLAFNRESAILCFRTDGAAPVQGQANIISNNIIYSSYKSGITVGDSYNLITGNSITNSNYNNVSVATEAYKAGILLFNGASYNIVNNNMVYNVNNNEDAQVNGYTKYGLYIDTLSKFNSVSSNFINDGMYSIQTKLYLDKDGNNYITGVKQRGSFVVTVASNATATPFANLPIPYRTKIFQKISVAHGLSLPGVFVQDGPQDALNQLYFTVLNSSAATQQIRIDWEVEGY